MIRSVYYILMMSMFAVGSLVNQSGYGAVNGSQRLMRYLIYGITLFTFLLTQPKKKKVVNETDILFVLLLLLVFGGSSLRFGRFDGLFYLEFYLTVYIVAMQECKERYLFFAACVFGVFGAGILAIMNFGSTLSGWNTNTISILCFQSFLIFHAAFHLRTKWMWAAYIPMMIFNMSMLEALNCRSAMLCILVTGILNFPFSFVDRMLKNKYALLISLMTPLIVALVTVHISALPIAQTLNTWSQEQFSKPIFNGRDAIWRSGFETLRYSPLLGWSSIAGRWHNSAVGCLVNFGILGYALYIIVFWHFLCKGAGYLEDVVVRRSMIAFLILNFQQCFENTLFAEGGIYMPYVLLGLLLGRIRYLKGGGADVQGQRYHTRVQYRRFFR